VLHELILERRWLEQGECGTQGKPLVPADSASGFSAVDNARANFLFLLNPTALSMYALPAAGERMP
jgi:hypothetical protein